LIAWLISAGARPLLVKNSVFFSIESEDIFGFVRNLTAFSVYEQKKRPLIIAFKSLWSFGVLPFVVSHLCRHLAFYCSFHFK